jgi:polyadenylation factor subunit 2
MQQYNQQHEQQGGDVPAHPRIVDAKPIVYDGKRMRKLPVSRKVIDYGSTNVNWLYERTYKRTAFDEIPFFPAHHAYNLKMLPPIALYQIPASGITTKFNHASTNKDRCPVNVVCWTPEGRRLVTGTSKGEFTLWNGMAFNFETIQQAHDHPIRSMIWSHNELFMATADQGGIIKYWQSNMNNLKAFQGHNACIRDISFCPSDFKFVSGADDATLKIWNFEACREEKVLTGHGSDVRCCDWHPHNSLIASGAKDYLVKIWDAKSAQNIVTLYVL